MIEALAPLAPYLPYIYAVLALVGAGITLPQLMELNYDMNVSRRKTPATPRKKELPDGLSDMVTEVEMWK